MEPNRVAFIVITHRWTLPDGRPALEYWNQRDDVRWQVAGACNQCGLCAEGDSTPDRYRWLGPLGTPGAVEEVGHDQLPDDPMMPEIFAALAERAAELRTDVTGCALTLLEEIA